MPLAPKPKVDDREAAIQAVIGKGLTTSEDQAGEEDKERQVVLFIRNSLLLEVDRLTKLVRPKTSRRAWLLEAVREKVERDGGNYTI